MRRDFIANVSHELKTPLTVISGFIETLQELDLDERQRVRFLQLMQEQSASMQRLVEDLLTLSALESEHNPVADEAFAIVPLLLHVSSDAKGLSKGQHAIELDIGDAATVTGSRDELASAFGNLVSNAIRYTPAGGTITLGWRVEGDGTGVFSVADTGIGIGPEHLPRLTERFYRVDRSRSRATGGTGLGLAIVKHVLLRHQAELDIASEPGKGSRFSVRLPARRVQRAPSGGGNVGPPGGPRHDRRGRCPEPAVRWSGRANCLKRKEQPAVSRRYGRPGARFDRPPSNLLESRVSAVEKLLEGFPSGQREQTVNLSALPSKVRILPPPPFRNQSSGIRNQLHRRNGWRRWRRIERRRDLETNWQIGD